MPTTPSEFVELAAELLGDEFAAFRKVATIVQATGWDNQTQSESTRTQSPSCIRLEYNNSQVDNNLILTGDVMLIGEYAHLAWEPKPNNTTVTFESIEYNVIKVTVDPAEATFTIQCRVT